MTSRRRFKLFVLTRSKSNLDLIPYFTDIIIMTIPLYSICNQLEPSSYIPILGTRSLVDGRWASTSSSSSLLLNLVFANYCSALALFIFKILSRHRHHQGLIFQFMGPVQFTILDPKLCISVFFNVKMRCMRNLFFN